MSYFSQWGLLLLAIFLLAFSVQATEDVVKTAVFLSPKFVLGPGQVENKIYYNIDFPRGHIAIKEFNGEVVDEMGNSVPLHETYLHHWVVQRYNAPKSLEVPEGDREVHSKTFGRGNAGVCQGRVLGQDFGIGSETRKTEVYVPDPYGVEAGNTAEIPIGFEERWMLNIHAIDTRGVVDRMGCTECRCDLYNITTDRSGRPLRPGYTGGLACCHDQTQCRLQEGFENIKRSLYLRYTVKWVDWHNTIVPAKIYIFDVTDTGERPVGPKRDNALYGCQIEYDVESCGGNGLENNGCVHTKKARIVIPDGGEMIYGVAHQHAGGLGSTLYGQDGRVLCSSLPIYGEGQEPGNEAGYVVGMTTCYPQPGTVKVSEKETLILESNYNSTQKHIGVMGLFYIMVVDSPPMHLPPVQTSVYCRWGLIFTGVAVTTIVGVGYVAYLRKNQRESGYQPVVIHH